MGCPETVKVRLFQAKNRTLPLSLLPSSERDGGKGTTLEQELKQRWDGECGGKESTQLRRREAGQAGGKLITAKLDQTMQDMQMYLVSARHS